MSLQQDDIFDSVIFLEENCQKHGFRDGFSEGKLKGWQEGLEGGVHEGQKLGVEIGFYEGFISTYLVCSGNQSDRVKTKIDTFLKLLSQDWHDNSKNLTQELETVRAKFKQICSILKVTADYTGKKDQFLF